MIPKKRAVRAACHGAAVAAVRPTASMRALTLGMGWKMRSTPSVRLGSSSCLRWGAQRLCPGPCYLGMFLNQVSIGGQRCAAAGCGQDQQAYEREQGKPQRGAAERCDGIDASARHLRSDGEGRGEPSEGEHQAACAQAEIHGGGSPRYDRCERLGREIGKPRGRQHVRLGRGKTYDASGKSLVFGIDKLQRQAL